ncbi:MAG: GntR family transcriptional regulator [Caldilinea sp.]|nr:GntR family transcriptional regulator [Caldilinea sp.]MDW8441891.1 GntR family transcriptional regulator [Caldilineaceae bacterium]
MQQKIDFQSPIPFYVQLMDFLRENIKQGVWRPGDQLPGEHALCEHYDVSRTVVRQALSELEAEGLIVRRRGKGAFVAEPKIVESLAQKLTGFYQDMSERGLRIITQVLIQEVTPAPTQVARQLEIPAETPVVHLHRLRFVEGEPILLVTSYLPHALCPGLEHVDLRNRSLYAYLEQTYGLVIARGRRRIGAVAADGEQAHLLGIDPGSPLLSLYSVSYLADDTPIEYYHAVHRGDRSQFEVELVRIHEQGQVRRTLRSTENDLPNSNELL